MNEEYDKLKKNLILIASEFFRFDRRFNKMIREVKAGEQRKYQSQYDWFSKQVLKALDASGLRIVNVDDQPYDPGMAVTPLNLEDFEADDVLYVEQTMEPIIMEGDTVIKTGIVILGRKAQ